MGAFVVILNSVSMRKTGYQFGPFGTHSHLGAHCRLNIANLEENEEDG
jgi:hypothetical protein